MSSQIQDVMVVPLWNFHLEGDSRLVLDRQLSIRKLTRKEKSQIQTEVGFSQALALRFCIQGIWRRKSKFDSQKGVELARKVIEALRLFSTGDVGAHFYKTSLRGDLELAELGHLPAEFATAASGRTYRINTDNREAFTAFWLRYSAREPRVIPQTHLDRFLKAYRHVHWHDRLIDFVTSMEGLVLPQEAQEKSKQFALRIAWLLRNEGSDPEKIFKEAQRIYNERSRVVHGEADVKAQKDIGLCRAAEEMNRRLLVRAMENSELFKKASLEKLVLGL